MSSKVSVIGSSHLIPKAFAKVSSPLSLIQQVQTSQSHHTTWQCQTEEQAIRNDPLMSATLCLTSMVYTSSVSEIVRDV